MRMLYTMKIWDYREFMAGLIKQRKKLAPIRLELSRDMDKKGIAVLCEYLETG